MMLSTLMKKGGLDRLATATSATIATSGRENRQPVADVAVSTAWADFSECEAIIREDGGLPGPWAEALALLSVMPKPTCLTDEVWQEVLDYVGMYADSLMEMMAP